VPQTILITGAGRGLGREMAVQAHCRGNSVIGTLRNPARAKGLPEGMRVMRLEATKATENAALAEALLGTAIDILVCNAGVFPARGGLREARYTELDWFAGLMTNVAGPFFAVRALIPNLRLASRPRVAIIASDMGSSANAAGGSYIFRTSKAAAVNLARNLAVELRPLGIAVGAYHPGWVRTDTGTSAAPVELCNSAAGLLERIEALDLDTTGVFEDYLGQPVPF
jgi:NAD(P)-dependent dehydrogenase (short-subunit alcohol dehydrogenase family)